MGVNHQKYILTNQAKTLFQKGCIKENCPVRLLQAVTYSEAFYGEVILLVFMLSSYTLYPIFLNKIATTLY